MSVKWGKKKLPTNKILNKFEFIEVHGITLKSLIHISNLSSNLSAMRMLDVTMPALCIKKTLLDKKMPSSHSTWIDQQQK